jgi:hypothetical protein
MFSRASITSSPLRGLRQTRIQRGEPSLTVGLLPRSAMFDPLTPSDGQS